MSNSHPNKQEVLDIPAPIEHKLQILHLEDYEPDAYLIREILSEEDIKCDITHVDNQEDFLAALERQSFDFIFADYHLPSFDALGALEHTKKHCPDVPFILISGHVSEEFAVDSLKEGATDYVLKEQLFKLGPVVRRATRETMERVKRRAAENTSLEKSIQLLSILETTIDAVIIVDGKGHIRLSNPAAVEMFQYSTQEADGLHIDRLITNLLNSFSDGEETETSLRIITEGLRKDGSVFPVEASVSRFSINRELHYSLIIRDITEQKMAEERLHTLNNELHTFMYKASHDLKGPCTSIFGLLDIMKRGLEENELNNYISFIEKSAKRLESTLEKLQSATKVKRGGLDIISIDLDGIVSRSIKSFEGIAGYENTEFDIQLHPDAEMYSDEGLIFLVLTSVIENAIKYQKQDAINKVSIQAKINEEEAYFEISDNGVGIPLKDKERVFDMFVRSNQSSEGSGLGLYITKNAIDKLQGTIELDSQEGIGSIFRIKIKNYLPKRR